ncbi:glycoside hydrolase family 5 protein [Mongoliitalea daihaiensis]|uniref:glycoside hydrolase family 5 protein n=1 Tax=Mongoliitalea daihaiensis TaxID=2782006 RepID=UPI001F1D2108|nr:cellulase family glycosylhydrolase [Mongoliitalea daihaiensis]UJP65490.1 cellulase family glycosylhydrolase [Mongoliitalea daihaiensis]
MSRLLFCWVCLIGNYPLQAQENKPLPKIEGMNLTGLERVWDRPVFRFKNVKKQLVSVQKQGISAVRMPLAFEYWFACDPSFEKKLKKVIDFSVKNDLVLVLSFFDHGLAEHSFKEDSKRLLYFWKKVLQVIGSNSQGIYLEIVNEPNLSPTSWEQVAIELISGIRAENSQIPIIVGATNSNSMFELSRMEPFPFEGLIYTFHYYEPYIFTHQGTEWTGNQHATMGIPYPFQKGRMPDLDKKAMHTAAEVNFRDYERTGNLLAVEDKISQIADWARRHRVQLWCTEYGVTINADERSRINYLEDVHKTLEKYQIPAFVWEWEGNFGVKELLETKN